MKTTEGVVINSTQGRSPPSGVRAGLVIDCSACAPVMGRTGRRRGDKGMYEGRADEE